MGPPKNTNEAEIQNPAIPLGGDQQAGTGGQCNYDQKVRPSFGKEVDFHKTIDCSGELSVLEAVKGGRFEPNKDIKEAVTTEQLDTLWPNPCWKPATGKHRPGEVFTWHKGSTGHTGEYFDDCNTLESTKTADASGPQWIKKCGSGVPVVDQYGANQNVGMAIFEFTGAPECIGHPQR